MTRPNTAHIRLDPELRQRLTDEAEARGVSVQWLASRLLAEGIDRLVPASEFRLTRSPQPTSLPELESPLPCERTMDLTETDVRG